MPARRDPVSELFDAGAARLLGRAYARPGSWVGTRIAAPTQRHARWARGQGIDLYGKDRAPGGRARNRWMRGFVRAVYYQHKWYFREGQGVSGEKRVSANRSRALQYEVGTVRLDRNAAGDIINRGRAVRIRVLPGGAAAQRAAAATPESRKIYVDGKRGPAWSNPDQRDY